ncbi:MAG TPA: hypothetical protein VLE73_05720 [Candidatus Saccharimonadales bacterium]|nr:hypothetical protein [Candidatus Saccharimonadales bacterium]
MTNERLRTSYEHDWGNLAVTAAFLGAVSVPPVMQYHSVGLEHAILPATAPDALYAPVPPAAFRASRPSIDRGALYGRYMMAAA